ncbi:hypothetical protein FOZ63_015827, partial [Perkinsus olseni]
TNLVVGSVTCRSDEVLCEARKRIVAELESLGVSRAGPSYRILCGSCFGELNMGLMDALAAPGRSSHFSRLADLCQRISSLIHIPLVKSQFNHIIGSSITFPLVVTSRDVINFLPLVAEQWKSIKRLIVEVQTDLCTRLDESQRSLLGKVSCDLSTEDLRPLLRTVHHALYPLEEFQCSLES